jgi:lactonase
VSSNKKPTLRYVLSVVFGWLLASSAAMAQSAPALVYTDANRGAVPIPSAEQGLQTVTAERWFNVSKNNMQLEGAAFDRGGDLLFVDVYGGRVLRLTPDKRLTVVIARPGWNPSGIAIHRDGRLFVAAVADGKEAGSILSMQPDGTSVREVVPAAAGYRPNDLVFDAEGGFYLTDFKGTSTEPLGGVYYVSPQGGSVLAVLPNISMANGVALSPDGKNLWITDYGRNELDRIELQSAATIAPFGTAVAYHFIGPAPDSMRADADGNLYVAVYGQGRVLVFNKKGLPIGQVLLPGRDQGHNLHSTSMAFRPGTNDLYIVSNDGDRGEGANIFHVRAFAKGLVLYSQR